MKKEVTIYVFNFYTLKWSKFIVENNNVRKTRMTEYERMYGYRNDE